jgi:cytochrome c-type biogenesis protein CcsB
MNQTLLSNGIFIYLFVLMLWSWIEPFFPKLTKKPTSTFFGICVANILVAVLLILRWIDSGHFPLSNLYESLIFLSWSFTAINLTCVFAFQNLTFLNAITTPITLLTYTFASFSLPSTMQKATALVPALQSNWLMMHVTIMILSYAALLCGSLIAFVFLLLPPSLKFDQHQSLWPAAQPTEGLSEGHSVDQVDRPIDQLDGILIGRAEGQEARLEAVTAVSSRQMNEFTPFGDTLDNLSYRILGLGFPLLTLGILSGAVWANEAWGSYWSWDPKETWALITWLVFAIYLHTRLTKGWRGTKSAMLATLGFITVWVCYLGVNLLGSGLHSYGWFSGQS